jgi:hypothetical protein
LTIKIITATMNDLGRYLLYLDDGSRKVAAGQRTCNRCDTGRNDPEISR